MLFVEFFKVYLDFLNTGADKCPAANLTQRLKVIFLKTRCQVKVKFREKKRYKVQQKKKIVQIQPTYILIQFKLLLLNKESRSITNMKYFFQKVSSQDISEAYFLVGDVSCSN